MPLKNGYSYTATMENFNALRKDGLTSAQAKAAAYEHSRKCFFKRFPEGFLPGWLAYPDGSRVMKKSKYVELRKKNPIGPSLTLAKESSWVIRNRNTGEIVMETFNKKLVEKLNTEKYEAIPILEYLQSLGIKQNPAELSRESQRKRAGELYRNFTGHEPGDVVHVDKPAMPDVLSVIGDIDGILYTTIRDGVEEKYIHTFKKKSRPLFCVSPDGKTIHLIGGSYEFGERGIIDK